MKAGKLLAAGLVMILAAGCNSAKPLYDEAMQYREWQREKEAAEKAAVEAQEREQAEAQAKAKADAAAKAEIAELKAEVQKLKKGKP
jgi:sortase (surface protein transpeptidase)